jgi:hypothetical protein
MGPGTGTANNGIGFLGGGCDAGHGGFLATTYLV